MLKEDVCFWKMARLIKDENERELVEQVFLQHYSSLKDLFIYLISKSSYPSITWPDYLKYCTTIQILDKYFTLPVLDEMFLATTCEDDDDTI